MRSKSFEGMACSIAGVLEAIGDRWAVLILRDLSLGLRRYEDLRRSTGVTNATLSDRLKHLEDNELIERRRCPGGRAERARTEPARPRRRMRLERGWREDPRAIERAVAAHRQQQRRPQPGRKPIDLLLNRS